MEEWGEEGVLDGEQGKEEGKHKPDEDTGKPDEDTGKPEDEKVDMLAAAGSEVGSVVSSHGGMRRRYMQLKGFHRPVDLSTVELAQRARLLAWSRDEWEKPSGLSETLRFCMAIKPNSNPFRSNSFTWVPESEPTLAVVFDAPDPFWNEDDRAELAMVRRLRSSKSTYRTAVMCLGMMQAIRRYRVSP